VPENYAGKVSKGSNVIVEIPDIDKTFTSEITFLSRTIGATTRGFTAEIRVPKGINLRPNQIALVKILDYTAPNSIAIPLNTLQTGENGKYVLVAEKKGDQLVAAKKDVKIGQLYGDSIEIKEGLTPGDVLITSGYQDLFEGQPITTGEE
jgi:multidrug efflux pump subunit AcrA (membrane-fusion protein)